MPLLVQRDLMVMISPSPTQGGGTPFWKGQRFSWSPLGVYIKSSGLTQGAYDENFRCQSEHEENNIEISLVSVFRLDFRRLLSSVY